MSDPLRVLLVEDSPTDAKLVLLALRGLGRPIEHERVEEEATMRALLEERSWDIVISDWSMPSFNALGALAVLKQTSLDLPFIIVSGTIGEGAAVDAMRAGASDYLIKDNLVRLAAAVERELREQESRAKRREAEAALAASEARNRFEEARFRALVENSADGIALSNANGELIYVSPACERVFGRPARELIGKKITEYLHPDDLPNALEQRAALVLFGGPLEPREGRVLRPDGTYRWLEVRATNLLSDPAIHAVVSNIRDIHDRKAAERALEIAQQRFATLFDSGIIGIAITDKTGRIHDANDTFLAMVGFSREELTQGLVDWKRLTPPEWETWNAQALEELRLHGRASPRAKEYFRKDGTRLPVLVGIATAEGDFRIAVSIDQTERKKADEALVERMQVATLSAAVGIALTAGRTLREALQRSAEAIVENLGVSLARIWTLNTEKRVLELEASAGIYTHIDGPHSRLAVDRVIVAPVAQDRCPAVSSALIGDTCVVDQEWARRDGIVGFAGHPLVVGGELVGVIAMFSRQPLTDNALAGLAAIAGAVAVGIDRRLVERAKSNVEAQLRQAQKMEAVGRLAGGVAHDFNNVLSVILSYGEFLLNDLEPGDPMRADVEEIQSAGRRAADLTRQLLMFSRQQVIEPKVVNLNDLLARLDKMLRRILGEDVELVLATHHSVGAVRVDPTSIEQVVMNLVVNARDAMPAGGTLTIETANVILDRDYVFENVGLAEGPHVRLSVTDTGAGMDKATQMHIFEPFFTTKARGKGTGLGLSTVFGIVQQSGGNVSVASELGVGTTFTVHLPRVDSAISPTVPATSPPQAHGVETILLVEDDDQVRAVARGILVRTGYTILEASNPGEALLISETHVGKIDLLLSDVIMPRMGGPELAARIVPMRPNIKVLYMSGYTEDRFDAGSVGQFAFIQKPITPETLMRKVRETLDAPRRPPGEVAPP